MNFVTLVERSMLILNGILDPIENFSLWVACCFESDCSKLLYWVANLQCQTSALVIQGSWNSIWNLELPPKVKNFMWRACHNCLPTRVKLQCRGVQCPTNCVVCAGPNEDISHLFFECGTSISCWQRTGLWNAILQIVQPSASCVENVFSILQQFDSYQKQVFGVTLWSIWKHRNNRVWNDAQESVQDICDRAGTLLTSWQNAQVIRQVQPNISATTACVQWKKPSPGRYKCNVDASFSNSLNKVGIGVCIRDEEGLFVLAKTEWFTPVVDVDLGEAMGLLTAMQWVKDLHLLNMDFEMDSKTVVDSVYGGSNGVSNYMAIINDCRHMLATDLPNSDLKFIRRQANGAAHSLAKEAPFNPSFHIYYNIPSCISDILFNEMQ